LLDGSFGSRTAALTDAYSDQPGNRGICYRRDEDVADLIEAAHTHGLQTAFHSIGDRAVAQLVSIHERLRKERENPLRHRIEHGELLDTTLVQRISGLDLVLGVQPAFEAAWGGPSGMYARRLGPRWARTNPLRSLATAGVKLAGGSDAPITPLDPLTGVRAAMTHPNEVERLDGPSALALFTTGAAYSLGLEDRTGRIASGMDADLVVLDADPRTGAPCRVLATYRRGRSAYHASTSVPTQP
jgi:predicted amidohydrolase YtcJ